MQTISLNGSWKLLLPDNTRIPASVPGSVYNDLLSANLMEDPFWRDNEISALKLMDKDYCYTYSFNVLPQLLDNDYVFLVCHGLDTLAKIEINGMHVADTDNMHRIWEFDVKQLLKAGKNTISIMFLSPTKYIKESYEQNPNDGSDYAMQGFPNLRKAHCMFGWDWGPRLPDAGIWRDIELKAYSGACIKHVHTRQHHSENSVRVSFKAELENNNPTNSYETKVYLVDPDGKIIEGNNNIVDVKDAKLWWPNGYGKQPLYKACFVLLENGKELDRWERKIGLRTIELLQKKDEWGESFEHCVNGVSIFAMGADYIPQDNILARVTKQSINALLQDCVQANFNTVRIWGGGYYPDDYFYDICDELGLLVWQDLMFACAIFTLTPEFEENVKQEIICNVRRLRHHASLAIWCGNNEMEPFLEANIWVKRPRQKTDYLIMYEHIFPRIIENEDPDTFYWPSSPSSGGSFDDPNSFNRGDVHYWEVWHGCKPFTDYRKHFFRYASEFGFQSFPCLKTVESFTLPQDRNVFSYVMEKHQRNQLANGKIMDYLSQTFLYPQQFDTLLYASQLLQAEAIRYGVEHWRRHRGRCMGAIYWQLNDCWPVASWASIDYFGRWKALHYAAKRFFAPIMLCCEENGLLSQTIDVNAPPFEPEMNAKLCVCNETMANFKGKALWSLRCPLSNIIESGEFLVDTAALSSQWFEKIDFLHKNLYNNYLSYVLIDDKGQEVFKQSVLFCPPKHFAFVGPKLSVKRNGDVLTVSAAAYARGVEIYSPDEDFKLSDNFFDMDAGTCSVSIVSGNPKTILLRSVYDIR